MVVVVIAGQWSGMEQTGKAAARQLALEPLSSDKCNKAPTSLLEIQILCCVYRFRFFSTWRKTEKRFAMGGPLVLEDCVVHRLNKGAPDKMNC